MKRMIFVLLLAIVGCAEKEVIVFPGEHANPSALHDCPSKNWKQCRDNPRPQRLIPITVNN